MAEAIDSFNAMKSAPTHNAVCPDFDLERGLFHLTCLAGQITEVSGAHELLSSSFSFISSKHYKYWIWQCRDIGGNVSLSVFLVEIHTNMAWPMLSDPEL